MNRFEDGGEVGREGGLRSDEEEDGVAEDGGVLEQTRAVLFELSEFGVQLVELPRIRSATLSATHSATHLGVLTLCSEERG